MGRPRMYPQGSQSQNEKIPLLKAIAVMRCLKSVSGSLAPYFPLLSRKLYLQEKDVGLIWLHRNSVWETWEVVPRRQKVYLEKIWRNSFLRGWRGRPRCSDLDAVVEKNYEVADEVAAEWISRVSGSGRDDNQCVRGVQPRIQTWDELSILTRYQPVRKVGATTEELDENLQDVLGYYKRQVDKLESKRAKQLRKAVKAEMEREKSKAERDIVPSTGAFVEGTVTMLEERIFQRIDLFKRKFYIPPNMISQLADQIRSELQSTLAWKKHIKTYIRTKRFVEQIKKKGKLVDCPDKFHPEVPIQCLLNQAVVQLVRIDEIRNVNKVPTSSGDWEIQLDATTGIVENSDENNNCPNDAKTLLCCKDLKQTSRGTSKRKCSGEENQEDKKDFKKPRIERKRKPCRPKKKKIKKTKKNQVRHGKLWRDIVKLAGSMKENDSMSQTSIPKSEGSCQITSQVTTKSVETSSVVSIKVKEPMLSSEEGKVNANDQALVPFVPPELRDDMIIVRDEDQLSVISDLLTQSLIGEIMTDSAIETFCNSYLDNRNPGLSLSTAETFGDGRGNENEGMNNLFDQVEMHESWKGFFDELFAEIDIEDGSENQNQNNNCSLD